MALFDSIKGAASKAREAEDRRWKEINAEKQAKLDRLEATGILTDISTSISQLEWFPCRQGIWDCNYRRVIVTTNAILVNNYADGFISHLEYTTIHNGYITYSFSEIRYDDSSADHLRAIYSLDSLGYARIENGRDQVFFAKALRSNMQKNFPDFSFSDVICEKKFPYFDVYVKDISRIELFP